MMNCFQVFLSISNLRRYTMVVSIFLFDIAPNLQLILGRGLHPSTLQLNLSRV
jgi:hypothetical protein